ncbi:poly-beta-1,6-N-acetyl-D-glucosamine N-deacetylase PgaB [Microbulbifer elongatus]|uniref:poly-beta-1,6-N-acetyl-D-glucosamine N-deacetylase PgaB n=1 Tax=Microbulbifer elongatus TaxID=86173 RepID=UPI001E4C8EEF|nr:poly-beta-1,6-N-acetyl-D-glucosamine N-deacetylase PgaB [Microbulbifer elongatus]
MHYWPSLLLGIVFSFMALCSSVHADPAEPGVFYSVALHDIADTEDQLDDSGITSDRLAAFFEWLAGNDWTPISLDDIARAQRGEAPLPDNAILLTVDDGRRSTFSRVYPLALTYRYPVVAAVVGQWMDTPAGGTVTYGRQQLPRSAFITWDEARQMQASGLIEFASHTFNLHREEIGNPQGNGLPAAVTRQYDPTRGYENETEYRARIRRDLQRARDGIQKQLGRAPRALVWPYGRYNQTTLEIARSAGFDFSLTLDPEPAQLTLPSSSIPMQVARYLPTENPSLGEWVSAMQFIDPWTKTRRIVPVDPSAFASDSAEVTNLRLGAALENLQTLGTTSVLVDTLVEDNNGDITASWFPTRTLPMQQDLLSRLAAQMRARAGTRVIIRFPHRQALRTLGSTRAVEQLCQDLGRYVPLDGLLLNDVPRLAEQPAETTDTPWQMRAKRRHKDYSDWPLADQLAMRCFALIEHERPGLQLFWRAPQYYPLMRGAALADITLVPGPTSNPIPLSEDERDPAPPYGLSPYQRIAHRTGLWGYTGDSANAAEIRDAILQYQSFGGTTFGWDPQDLINDRPPVTSLSPTNSARTFPAQGTVTDPPASAKQSGEKTP